MVSPANGESDETFSIFINPEFARYDQMFCK